MIKNFKINDVVIGEGRIKKIVPVFGFDISEIDEHIRKILLSKPDIIEFRADYLGKTYNREDILEATEYIKDRIKRIPLLFTFRTFEQGGMKSLPEDQYKFLISEIVGNNLFDIIDVEYPILPNQILRKDFPVIYSLHRFDSVKDLKINSDMLSNISDRKNVVLKIAVKIYNESDLFRLQKLSNELRNLTNEPLIIVGMGKEGIDTRKNPANYNSSLTFMKRGKESAAGQIDILDELFLTD